MHLSYKKVVSAWSEEREQKERERKRERERERGENTSDFEVPGN